MDGDMWGWSLMGAIVLGNIAIYGGLIRSLLKKQDLLEEKLMAMSQQFPHQAYVTLQQSQIEAQMKEMALRNGPAHTPIPDWQTEPA